MVNNFDIAIIGSGVSGTFAALKIAKEHKGMKVILFDTGSAPGKRRSQMEGFLGTLPTGDGKLYLSDLDKISKLIGTRKSNTALKWFNNYVKNIFDLSVIKDTGPKTNLDKKIKKSGFEVIKNDYIQLYPKEIHTLSKKIVNDIEKNTILYFDEEIKSVVKNKNNFTISSQSKQITCKKVIICTGRSGWRWTNNLYNSFGIVTDNNIAKFGIRVEILSNIMKDFNKSNCSIISKDLEIGPLSWNGTVIPEDHTDMAISSFRSNEARWNKPPHKVSFNLIGNRVFLNKGFEQVNRIGQLTFILADDRVMKEKISHIIKHKSIISVMEEYSWLPDAIEKVGVFMPEIINKGYFYVPTILPMTSKINVKNNMETDVSNMFCAGEASGNTGLLSAILTGLTAADATTK
jgi:thioredoxin reductase